MGNCDSNETALGNVKKQDEQPTDHVKNFDAKTEETLNTTNVDETVCSDDVTIDESLNNNTNNTNNTSESVLSTNSTTTVSAVKYELYVVDSPMDYYHGGGYKVTEYFVPLYGFAFNNTVNGLFKCDNPRNEFVKLVNGVMNKKTEQLEQVELPVEFVEKCAQLVDLKKELKKKEKQLQKDKTYMSLFRNKSMSE